MDLPIERDLFSNKNLGGGFVEIATYTASMNQIIITRVRFDDLDGDNEYEVRFSITPSAGSERECVGAAWSMSDTNEGRYIHSCEIFLEENDVIKVYAKNLSGLGDAAVSGEVIWINKTPLQFNDVAADNVEDAFDGTGGVSFSADILGDIDSTGAETVTMQKAIELLIGIMLGKANYNSTTGVWNIKGRDGSTTIFSGKVIDEGDRTESDII